MCSELAEDIWRRHRCYYPLLQDSPVMAFKRQGMWSICRIEGNYPHPLTSAHPSPELAWDEYNAAI